MTGQTQSGRIPWRLFGWGAAGLLLLLPLAAMQLTDEVAWDAFDFAFAAALLGLVGLGFELAVRKSAEPAYRAGAGVALAAALLVVWITGAVGIIGSEREDANLLYAGVLAVALIGAAAARLRPSGMAWAMSAAAIAQALAPVIAAALGAAPPALVFSPKVLGVTGFLAALWLLSAWLFRQSARHEASPTR